MNRRSSLFQIQQSNQLYQRTPPIVNKQLGSREELVTEYVTRQVNQLQLQVDLWIKSPPISIQIQVPDRSKRKWTSSNSLNQQNKYPLKKLYNSLL